MRPPTKEIARDWRAAAWLPYRWREASNQAGVLPLMAPREAGGLMVTCDEVGGRRAYMKPRRRDPEPKRARAAREKIASDLAHDLGVQVPPVILAERWKPGSDEKFVCVSLVVYPRQWSWYELKPRIAAPPTPPVSELLHRTLLRAAAWGFAFDTWVGQTDHDDHPHNIVFGYDPDDYEDSSWLFLDYAMAFGFDGAWGAGAFRNCTAAPFPPLMMEHLDTVALSQAVDRIEACDEAFVSDVVNRIPESHLRPDEGRVILEGLLARRGLVRQALSSYTPGGGP